MRKSNLNLLFIFAITSALSFVVCKAQQERTSVWNLTARLSEQQLAVNLTIYEKLEPDECDSENQFDPVVKAMIETHGVNAPQHVGQFVRTGDRQRQAAGCRGLIYLAHEALMRKDYGVAAGLALDVYLSSAPHRLRLEALRIYCRAADPAQSEKWFQRVQSGSQDPRFQPLLPELAKARADRATEQASAAGKGDISNDNTP